MQFGFYEEFPTEDNLKRLDDIDFPLTHLVISAENVDEFYELERKLKKHDIEKIVYWPRLEEEEGYWFSPWSENCALGRKIQEVLNRPNQDQITIHWDAEPPLIKGGRHLLLKETPNFLKKRENIQDFIKNASKYNIRIITGEIPSTLIPERILRHLGLSFNPNYYGNDMVKGLYTSFKHYVPFL